MSERGSAREASAADRLEMIRRFVAEAADCQIEEVTDESDLYAGLGVDSLGIAAIFIDLSYAFGIPEPEADIDFAALNTPIALARYVAGHLDSPSAPGGLIAPQSNAGTVERQVAADPAALLKSLPYGDAMRCVDGIELLTSDRILTTMTWQAADQRVAAHLINRPGIVPGVFLAEQVAQSALLLALQRGVGGPGRPIVLAKLMCDFQRTANAPCTIIADVRVHRSGIDLNFIATSRVDGREVAQITGIARPLRPDAAE